MAGMNDHGADGSVIDLNSTLIDDVNQDTTSLSEGPDGLNIAKSSRGNTGPTEDLILNISNHNAPNHCPGLSAESAEDNGSASRASNMSSPRDSESEPRLSLGTPGISRQENGGSSDGGSALSGKGKEVQVPEAGSSSNPPQVDSNRSNVHLVHSHGFLPPPYQMNFQQHPLRNMAGLHVSPDLVPHQGITAYPGMPQGYFDQRMHLGGRQNPVLFNALETTNAPLHSEFHPHQSSQPMWFNEFASSPPAVSQMMPGPSMWRNVPPLPLTANSNVRTEVPVERGQVPAMRNPSQQPRPQSPAIGNIGSHGSTFTYSELHQWHAPPSFYEPNYGAVNQQTLSDYPPWSLPHPDSLGPDARYIGLAPCPHHTRYGYFLDAVGVPGPGNQSHNSYSPGPSIPQSGNHPARHAVPQTSQPVEVPTNTEDWMIPEDGTLADQINAAQQRQTERILMYMEQANQFLQRQIDDALPDDRYREMRLDVDNMPYEELIALQEALGKVSTGLPVESIMKLLKRRSYESRASDPSTEAETCCICREEYVGGEETGMVDCGHEFHTGCIKQWLLLKNECPICKTTALAS